MQNLRPLITPPQSPWKSLIACAIFTTVQINVASSHISYNRLGGIRLERSEVRNLQITGNDIEYNNHKSHLAKPEPTAEI